MHVPIYLLVFHLAARACALDRLHAWVEAWLARRAPAPMRTPLQAAVGDLDVCYASVGELPVVRPRSVLGGPVGAEEAATLAQADQALVVRARPRASPDFEAFSGLMVLAAAFSAETAGVIFDPQRSMLLPLDLASEPPARTPLELARRLGIPSIRHTARGSVTVGLIHLGLPELLLAHVEPFERVAATALLRATSRVLVTSGLRERFELPEPPDGLALQVTLCPTSTPSVLEVRPDVPQRALLPTFACAGGQVVPGRAPRGGAARIRLLRRALTRSTVRFRGGTAGVHPGSRRGTWLSGCT